MSNEVATLRKVQMDRRLVANKLGEINSEIKNHPARTTDMSTESEKLKWISIRAVLERRKAALKERLTDLEAEQDELQLNLSQTPVTRASLGHIIDTLISVETRFTTNSAEDAWDGLTAFIDWLERENNRVNVEEQVAKLEAAA